MNENIPDLQVPTACCLQEIEFVLLQDNKNAAELTVSFPYLFKVFHCIASQTVNNPEFSVPDVFETFRPALLEILNSWIFQLLLVPALNDLGD